MSIDLSQFIPTFLEESFEGLELMESTLLTLKQDDDDAINAIFRAAHSIKGGAGTFGFVQVSDFTHEVETLLDEMRDGRRALVQQDVDMLLRSVDCIKLLIESAREGHECDDPQVAENFKQIQASLKGGANNIEANSNQSNSDAQQSVTIDTGGQQGWLIDFNPSHQILQTGNDVLRLFIALAEFGELTSIVDTHELPPLDELDPQECLFSWQITLISSCSEDDINEVFEWVEDECELTIAPLGSTTISADNNATDSADNSESGEAYQAPQISDEQAEQSKASQREQVSKDDSQTANNDANESPDKNKQANPNSGSIRVGIDKVDTLINRVGELVITQAMLKQIGNELSDVDDDTIARLKEGLVQLEGNSRELQEDVMRIRMLPISFVFNRFPRMVYDISSKLGKLVELKLSGESTELDKTVMEKIGDPLVHLVRNSLDHGLEMPDERLAAGKNETGVVHLKAYHQGGYINIDISDDGRGIDTQKIHDKALEKGLIAPDQVLTEQEINELIFAPGFSTAETVSDISGRGVGMDVVRRNIESLGGHVSLSSTPGRGSIFSVSLPLTLAIIDGQLINVADQTYIVPLVSIVESIQIDENALKGIAGQQSLYLYREQYIPLYSIRRLFSLPGQAKENDEKMVIIVESNGVKYALLVDELLDQQQVVLKSLEVNYMVVQGVSGATILGNGGVALIVDIKGLVTMRHQRLTRLADTIDNTEVCV